MHTSFLSSIFPLDVGVALAFDVLVKLIPLIDNDDESCSDLIRDESLERIGAVLDRISFEFDLISVEVGNVSLRITPFRWLNEEFELLSIKSKRPMGS